MTIACEHTSPVDFDQLNIFLEVARHSSFSRAAEKCFRTQPAISSQVRSLEEEVGARLFDRSGGKVKLTIAGKIFQRWAEETMESRRSILNTVADIDKVPRGEIVVSANEATCLYVLPEVFSSFKRQYADVRISIHRAERSRILEMVLDNVVDFGVVSLPVDDPRLTAMTIHRDELVVITTAHSPLASFKSISIDDAVNYPLLLPKSGRTRDAIQELFAARGLKPTISMELDSSELLKRFVSANMGIGFVARSNVQAEIKARSLAALTVSDAQIRRDLALVYRKGKSHTRAARTFIEIAMATRPSKLKVLPA